MSDPVVIRGDVGRLMKPIERPPLPIVTMSCGSCAFIASGRSQEAAHAGLSWHRRAVHLTAPPRLRVEVSA